MCREPGSSLPSTNVEHLPCQSLPLAHCVALDTQMRLFCRLVAGFAMASAPSVAHAIATAQSRRDNKREAMGTRPIAELGAHAAGCPDICAIASPTTRCGQGNAATDGSLGDGGGYGNSCNGGATVSATVAAPPIRDGAGDVLRQAAAVVCSPARQPTTGLADEWRSALHL
eukprot:NODE_21854_length_734_cov_1.957166.p2 GENE.NODE_21854_length_734_cov_1.957166~~NODE_21854_length_734_cov_1.957166.p2  ORF type:complete len:171 (-),score=5.41 NODE_21854_length_734_cov_1.957166:11-523(-)